MFSGVALLKVALYTSGLVSVLGIWIGLGANVTKIRERFRINRELKLSSYNREWLKNKWMRNYHFLLTSAIRKYEVNHFSKVVVSQFILFVSFSALLILVIEEIRFSIIISTFFIYFIPLGFLYFFHKQKQNDLQNNLVEASVLLLQEYEKNHYNMIYALKEVITQSKGASQIAYSRLFARMHDDDETKEMAAESFSFQLGHFRGKNLSSIILRACKDGVIVTTLLEDLVEDITEFNKRISDAETEARETAFIGIAILPSLIILHVINDQWLIPGGNAFYYQFQTEQGLKSFLIATAFGLVGVGLALFIRKPKK
jgi:Flp pilus assembly protein TadB